MPVCISNQTQLLAESHLIMKSRFVVASATAGVLLAGAKDACCNGASGGPLQRMATKSGALLGATGRRGGSRSEAPASTYSSRLKRLVKLMNPGHIFTTKGDLMRHQALIEEHRSRQTLDADDEEILKAKAAVDACINPASGEIIPPPFRLSGYMACNVPIVATMLLTRSVYVQVLSHWVNQSLNTAVNYYNRSGAEMTAKSVMASYSLAIGTACPLAFGLGKAFQRAPPSIKRFSFMAPYVAVAAAGSMNVLFTRSSEITGGVKVTDESGEVRGVSKKAGLRCVVQTIISRGIILPLPVVVLPALIVGLLEKRALMPASSGRTMLVKAAVITASLAVALPASIAVFPQEAKFKAVFLEPEFQHLRLRRPTDGAATYLYANKGL